MSDLDDLLFRLNGGWPAVIVGVISFLIKWFVIGAIFGTVYWLIK